MIDLILAVILGTVYAPAERVEYLREMLQSVKDTEPRTLEDTYGYIDVMDRNECRSIYHRLRAQCLVEAARRSCRGRRGRAARRACQMYSDVIVTNKLSEKYFVTTSERYRIMSRHRDFRQRLRLELRRRYGSLATDFGLSRHAVCPADDVACTARGIDAFCAEYADTRSLSWQHCAAAMTWFVGTARSD